MKLSFRLDLEICKFVSDKGGSDSEGKRDYVYGCHYSFY